MVARGAPPSRVGDLVPAVRAQASAVTQRPARELAPPDPALRAAAAEAAAYVSQLGTILGSACWDLHAGGPERHEAWSMGLVDMLRAGRCRAADVRALVAELRAPPPGLWPTRGGVTWPWVTERLAYHAAERDRRAALEAQLAARRQRAWVSTGEAERAAVWVVFTLRDHAALGDGEASLVTDLCLGREDAADSLGWRAGLALDLHDLRLEHLEAAREVDASLRQARAAWEDWRTELRRGRDCAAEVASARDALEREQARVTRTRAEADRRLDARTREIVEAARQGATGARKG